MEYERIVVLVGSTRDWPGLIDYPIAIGVRMVGRLPVAPVVPGPVVVPVIGAFPILDAAVDQVVTKDIVDVSLEGQTDAPGAVLADVAS